MRVLDSTKRVLVLNIKIAHDQCACEGRRGVENNNQVHLGIVFVDRDIIIHQPITLLFIPLLLQ